GGVGAVATSSGQSALSLIVTTLTSQGSHVVASSSLYGGTLNFLTHTMPRFGVTTTFADVTDPAAIRAAIRPETRLLVVETIGNPAMTVADLPALAETAHSAGIPLVVDNTFTSPYLCRPGEWGADIVFHSATKYISGHGSVMGGVVVDIGSFDWAASDRYPTLSRPYPPYAGVVFTDHFGVGAFAALARMEGIRDFGACLGAETAYRLLEGLESLPVRMERHSSSALRVA